MEDENKLLLVLWTVFAGFVILIYLWKRYKYLNNVQNTQEVSKTSRNVQEARLKRFKLEQNVDGNREETTETTKRQSSPEEKVSESKPEPTGNTFRRRKGKGNGQNQPVNERVIIGPNATQVDETNLERHFDPDTGSPITQPLKTLEEALLWRPGYDEFNVATAMLPSGFQGLANRPRTLVCHDMKGGYIEDRFVQGYPSSDCYRIYHWQYIDLFTYFSHHFITIPPPCWTNAAHSNSVMVLGTLITEWEDGAKRCDAFLEDEHSYKALANQLVDITEYYNFDGWLINIENPIQPGKVINLVNFVDYLTKVMHASNGSSLVIWYDSITNKGDLKWQNELNSLNSPFFDVCDGIFVNYTWSIHQLSVSGHAATAYGRSTADVYVGVDVFGRGCYEGGGYKTRLAVKAAREEKLSAAIFAPGWVLETQGEQNFTANQNKFWSLLSKDCPTHPMVTSIPFVTSLCQGYGEKVFIDGKVVLSHPWTNLSCQQAQPSYNNAFYNLGGKGGIIISDVGHSIEDAYNGGGCQLVQGRTRDTLEKAKGVVRLFEADFTLANGILVSLTYKLTPKDCFQVGLQFHTDRMPTYIVMCPAPRDPKDYAEYNSDDPVTKMTKRMYGVSPSRILTTSAFTSPIGKEHFEAYAPLTGGNHSHVGNTLGVEGEAELWCTRHYLITGRHLVGCKVKEIRVVCAKPVNDQSQLQGLMSTPFKLHIGEIKILDPHVLKQKIPTVSDLRHRNVIWQNGDHGNKLSLTLMWDCPKETDVESVPYCDVFVVIGNSQSYEFVGRAFVDAYRVCNLSVSEDVSSVEFTVQAVTVARRKKTLSNSSSVLFTWH